MEYDKQPRWVTGRRNQGLGHPQEFFGPHHCCPLPLPLLADHLNDGFPKWCNRVVAVVYTEVLGRVHDVSARPKVRGCVELLHVVDQGLVGLAEPIAHRITASEDGERVVAHLPSGRVIEICVVERSIRKRTQTFEPTQRATPELDCWCFAVGPGKHLGL